MNNEENKNIRNLNRFAAVTTIALVMAFVMISSLAFEVINLKQTQGAYQGLNTDLIQQMQIIDKKIWITSLAHNTETESWFMGNRKIENISSTLWAKMGEATKDGNLTWFNNCIDVYDEVNSYLMPSINRSSRYVEGFIMYMFDVDMNEIGFIEFKEKSAEYSTENCGRVFYDKNTDTLTYDYPGEMKPEPPQEIVVVFPINDTEDIIGESS